MAEVGVDFGTSNTVLARYNETLGRAETLEIPGITSEMRYRLTPDGEEHRVWVTPSVIHYAEQEVILIGDQVVSRGLVEHPDTMRWMKRAIAQGSTRRRKTSQGHIGPAQAGEDFLRILLTHASEQVSFDEDTFTFTVPVEAFETFQDWLMRVCETIGIKRVRLLDEPTASIFGYHGATRQDERFVVFDFGGGTLDISVVRLDTASQNGRKAIQLGCAGCDLGGMDIDQWIAEDFCGEHQMQDHERRDLEAIVLRGAEAVKKELSDPLDNEANLTVTADTGQAVRLLQTSYSRSCSDCERGQVNVHEGPETGCLGCLLLEKGFHRRVRETLDRAVENATAKVGMRRSDVTQVLVTGGTSLIPSVRRLLEDAFGGRVVFDHPFDSVVRGACKGEVEAVLRHDYAIESYSREQKAYEFKSLFEAGTEFPTSPERPRRLWCKGIRDGMTRIGINIYEVSRVRRRDVGLAVSEDGVLKEAGRVATEYAYICLNSENPTFITADPPVSLVRDEKRFLSSFAVDGNRRLLVTVIDQLISKTLLKDHPVVRL